MWIDEAADFTPEMFDVLRARDILDAGPVPEEGRYVHTEHGWKPGVGFYTKRGDVITPVGESGEGGDSAL